MIARPPRRFLPIDRATFSHPLVVCLLAVSLCGCEQDSDRRTGKHVSPANPSNPDAIAPADASPPSLEPFVAAKPTVPAASALRTASELSQPAPTATAVQVPAWLPLSDAKPGEWAEYETLDGRRLRYDVLKVAASSTVTRVTLREAGRTWGEPATREDNPHLDLLARKAERHNAARRYINETLELAGQKWEAGLYEDRWTDEDIPYVRRTWVSHRAPCFGTLRMELYGDEHLEASLILIDYGPR